jgi:DNA polymerase III subunit gamma/tau
MPWYNTYRPQKFTEVTGQKLIIQVLQNSLKSNKIKQAYLFSGSKGIGKTSIARIFASELNQIKINPEHKIDILEMDAASNTGIDDIRNLIESAQIPPISGQYKIYIIDEVHMLSKSAMNALLKILEEPPKYLIFLLATTNPEKIIPTVLSRLTIFRLNQHTLEDIIETLQKIITKENLKIDSTVLKLIANKANGSLRDAINLLETIASYGLTEYSLELVTQILGITSTQKFEFLANKLLSHDSLSKDDILYLSDTNLDGQRFLEQFLEYLLDLSLEQNNKFDSLIWPVARIVDLRLPITSITASLSLLQVKTSQDLQISKAKNKRQSLVTKIQEAGQSEIQPADQPADQVEKKPENTSSLIEEIEKEFKNQSLKKDTSPILKLILPDVQVVSINDSILELQVSSPLFESQLKIEANIQKITEIVKSKFDLKISVKTSIKNKNSKSSLIIQQDQKLNEQSSIQNEEEPLEISNQSEKPIFYKTYKQLPGNLEGSDVQIIDSLIKPEKQDWDTHTKNMFDFE